MCVFRVPIVGRRVGDRAGGQVKKGPGEVDNWEVKASEVTGWLILLTTVVVWGGAGFLTWNAGHGYKIAFVVALLAAVVVFGVLVAVASVLALMLLRLPTALPERVDPDSVPEQVRWTSNDLLVAHLNGEQGWRHAGWLRDATGHILVVGNDASCMFVHCPEKGTASHVGVLSYSGGRIISTTSGPADTLMTVVDRDTSFRLVDQPPGHLLPVHREQLRTRRPDMMPHPIATVLSRCEYDIAELRNQPGHYTDRHGNLRITATGAVGYFWRSLPHTRSRLAAAENARSAPLIAAAGLRLV